MSEDDGRQEKPYPSHLIENEAVDGAPPLSESNRLMKNAMIKAKLENKCKLTDLSTTQEKAMGPIS